MTGYTPRHALPYPDDYQQPADTPAVMQALAGAADTAIPKIATGVATTSGDVAVVVPFPPGRFTAAPRVVVTPVGSVETPVIPQIWTDPNVDGFALIAYRLDGVKVAWPFQWIAIQE